MIITVTKIHDMATGPSKGSFGAAGWDLSSCETTMVPARGRKLVNTGLVFTIPMGLYGRVAPRSGLALRKGIDVGAGVIDPDYCGPVGVLLFNHSDEDVIVDVGDRIAQIIFTKIETTSTLVESDEVMETRRGRKGWGSTGN